MRAAHGNRNDGDGEIAVVARLVLVDSPVAGRRQTGSGDNSKNVSLPRGPRAVWKTTSSSSCSDIASMHSAPRREGSVRPHQRRSDA